VWAPCSTQHCHVAKLFFLSRVLFFIQEKLFFVETVKNWVEHGHSGAANFGPFP
jgi:hypothetical protein